MEVHTGGLQKMQKLQRYEKNEIYDGDNVVTTELRMRFTIAYVIVVLFSAWQWEITVSFSSLSPGRAIPRGERETRLSHNYGLVFRWLKVKLFVRKCILPTLPLFVKWFLL